MSKDPVFIDLADITDYTLKENKSLLRLCFVSGALLITVRYGIYFLWHSYKILVPPVLLCDENLESLFLCDTSSKC